MAQGKYVKRRNPRQPRINAMVLILAALLLFLGIMLCVKSCTTDEPSVTPPIGTGDQTNPSQNSQPRGEDTPPSSTEQTTAPTQPHVTTTASIGVTGDVLVHGPLIQAAKESNGTYDFNSFYKHIDKYFKEFDFMVANLEVTLGGTAAGPYQGI